MSSGAPAEIKGKAVLFERPISLITCVTRVGRRHASRELVEAGLHEDEAEFSEFELPTDQVPRTQLRANISTNTEATACVVFAVAVPSLRTRRFRSTALI